MATADIPAAARAVENNAGLAGAAELPSKLSNRHLRWACDQKGTSAHVSWVHIGIIVLYL